MSLVWLHVPPTSGADRIAAAKPRKLPASNMDDADPCVSSCTRCPALVDSRSQIVNGVGPVDAELLIIGEAPGAREDTAGEPFVGRSGQLLTEALTAAGIDRESVRITNCVRCRPPDNRNPRTEERENCTEWLHTEIAAVDPEIILTVGKVPSSHLLDRDVAVTAAAGSIEHVEIGGQRRPIVICVHPAAVLYDRSQEERLAAAISVAATRIGAHPPQDDQANLTEF